MHKRWLVPLVLLVSGAVAVFIGLNLLWAPTAFYESYRISLPDSVDLRSELRGSASLLLLAGAVILAGVFRPGFRSSALLVALGLYGAFVVGRLISAAFDGTPSGPITIAWAVELGLLVLNVILCMLDRRSPVVVVQPPAVQPRT